MQRPLIVNKARFKSLHSNIFQPQQVRFTFDCTYALFTHILREIKQQYHSTDTILYHPSTLFGHIPSSSTGPLQIIFRRFKDLAKWFHVQDQSDITRLLYRYSKSSSMTAVSVLGSTIYDESKDNEGIDVFLGKSSSVHNKAAENQKDLDQEDDVSFCLPTKEWDSANNNCYKCNLSLLTTSKG